MVPMLDRPKNCLPERFNAKRLTNLVDSYFNKVVVREVDTEVGQGSGGLRVEFDIGHHALGKGEAGVWLSKLANLCGVKQVDGETGRTIKPGEMLD